MNHQENNKGKESMETNNEHEETPLTDQDAFKDSPKEEAPKNKFKFFISKVGVGAKIVGGAIGSGLKNVTDKVQSFTDEQELKKKKRKAFENDCQTYLIVGKTNKSGASYLIQAVRFREKNELFFMYDEKDLTEINSHVRLQNTSDGSEIEILEVEKGKTSYYPITIEDMNYEIAGIMASYRLYQATIPSVHITNNSIQNNNINGDNAQISQVITYTQELDTLQSEITNSKVNLFQKKKKEEALNLFGNFKNCVINQKKDESLFKKFLKVLGELGLTVAIKIAETLISKIG